MLNGEADRRESCSLLELSHLKLAPHSKQLGYRSRDALQRDCLLRVVVQGPGSFRSLVNFLYDVRLRSYCYGLKVSHFSEFGLFSPYKIPKKYLPVISLQPRGYIAE